MYGGTNRYTKRQTCWLLSVGMSDIGSHSWVQLPPNRHRQNTISGDAKQALPAPEVASQGLADITNQAARSQHAEKVGSQIPVAGPPLASQVSTVSNSNTLQPTHQQAFQAVTIGSSNSTPPASVHSPKPASLTTCLHEKRDPVRQAGAVPTPARGSFTQAGALPVPARGSVMQSDQTAGPAASTLQASSLSQDHAEAQGQLPSQDHVESQQLVLSQDLVEAQQQHLPSNNSNLPRLVGLLSTLCLLDLPDLKGRQGKDGKLTLAAERVRPSAHLLLQRDVLFETK